MTSRVLAFLAAVVVHIALITLLARDRAIRDEPPTDKNRMVLVFLTQDAIAESAESATTSPRSSRRARQAPDRSSDFSGDRGPISEPPRGEYASPLIDPSIDWSRQSELAAQRQVDAIEAARRRDRSFTSHDGDRRLAAPSAPPPEFGWDRARTHRIEPIPSGGTIIHLNDRCFIVISGLIMPACKLGKIEARGDLFEHMDDTPQLGDAK